MGLSEIQTETIDRVASEVRSIDVVGLEWNVLRCVLNFNSQDKK
jgi:hypothetical protein